MNAFYFFFFVFNYFFFQVSTYYQIYHGNLTRLKCTRERLILSPQSWILWLLQTLSVCFSVCPSFMAYVSFIMGWISMKLGWNVGKSFFHKIGSVMTSFFGKGQSTATVFPTWNRASSASVDLLRSVADECVAQALTRWMSAASVDSTCGVINELIARAWCGEMSAAVSNKTHTHTHTETDTFWWSRCLPDCDSSDNDVVFKPYLSVCLSRFYDFISVTLGLILMKLG